ncbi:MAG: hypothetical protein ACJAYJ_001929 [Saprospiraceae bacterium]|jgi:hypothetical protein
MKKEILTSFFAGKILTLLVTSLLVLCCHLTGFSQCVTGGFSPQFTGMSLTPAGPFADESLIPIADAASDDGCPAMCCVVIVTEVGLRTRIPANPAACEAYQINIDYEINESDGSTDMMMGTLTTMVDPTLCIPVFSGDGNFNEQCLANAPPAPTSVDCIGNAVAVTETSYTNNGGSGNNGDPLIITRTYTASTTCGGAVTTTQIITIEDTMPAIAICMDITVQLDATGNITIADDAVNNGSTDNCGMILFNIIPGNFDCDDIGANTVTLLIQDEGGQNSSCTAVVTIEEATNPIAVCQNITIPSDINGDASIVASQVDGGSSDNCGTVTLSINISTFDCSNVGGNIVVLTATDGSNNMASCNATVTIEDNIAPQAICQNLTIQLDATGNFTVPAASIDNGSSDACNIVSTTLDLSTFNCTNIGGNVVVLTVVDANGNNSNCTATITVEDDETPTANCQNITVQLDATGSATIAAAALDNGSTDNCTNLNFTASLTAFTCANVGANNVTLTVSDNAGNTDQCTAIVTVEDNVSPTALCMDATVQLDAAGNAAVTTAQINNGSNDACGLGPITLDVTAFTCVNLGANTVTLTVNDANGNSATCTATVTVQDLISPTAICQDITVQLDAAGGVGITAADVNNGSFDNCNIASVMVLPNSFDCSNIGNVNATLMVTDAAGNSMTCVAIVTIEDNMDPTPVCQNVDAILDANGNATVSVASVDNGSSDNCNNVSFSLSQTVFTCADIATNPNSVTLTVNDNNGNSATCTADVTVIDNAATNPVCQNITIQLDGTGNETITAAQIDGGSSDNCGIASISASPTAFTCANTGANTVVLTLNDVNGNTATCTAIVTVEENVLPMAICMSATVQLDNAGNVTVTAATINNGSSDNCGTVNFSVSPSVLTCANVGTNTVTLTVTDGTGNSNTCDAVVTIQDMVDPTAVCQNINAQLDAAGNATIAAIQIDGGSTDACGIAITSANITTFTCANLGANNVTLTVTDNNGNSDACVAVVTVQDNVNPMAICQNTTVILDAAGNGSIVITDINNGSSDNCGSVTLSASQTTFTCANVGNVTVVLTANDGKGNTATCDAIVTVQDDIDPNEICQNAIVQLDATGNATIATTEIDNGSTDACGIMSLSVSPNAVTCADIGTSVVVTLTVIDNNGNMETCMANVTVEDNQMPTAICQNIAILLDNTGNATITPNQLDNGSSDACSAVIFTASQTVFTCADLGANTVTLFVEDAENNMASCTATVTVTENMPMVLNCPADIDMMTSGNCTPVVTFTEPMVTGCNYVLQSQTHASGDMFPQGTTTVTYVFSDGTTPLTCTFDVTVTDMGAGSAPMLNCGSLTAGVAANTVAGVCTADGFNLTPVTQSDDCGAGNLTLTYSISGQTTSTGTGIISNTFDFNLGVSTVVYVLTDNSGNSDDCSFTVTVNDVEKPTLDCSAYQPTMTVNVDGGMCTKGNVSIPATPTDNCSVATLTYNLSGVTAASSPNTGINDASNEVFNSGTTIVQYVATDINGNVENCSFNVVVNDNENPVVTCPIAAVLTVNTDSGTCGFMQPGTTFNPTFLDNCPNVTIENDRSDTNTLIGENFSIGTTTVIWTATDGAGNEAMCTIDIIVQDNETPNAVCQNIIVQLDAAGNATIVAADIDGGSTDNCGIMSLMANPTAFTCANVGTNNVTLTVTDNSSNTDNCVAVVTVEDNVAPMAMCEGVVPIQLDANGTATIAATDLNDGSSDACGMLTFAAFQTVFTCADVGNIQVILTVTDANGNTDSCTTFVGVADVTDPTAVCQNATVQLDAAGNATVTSAEIDNGSADTCGIATLAVSPDAFTCANVGIVNNVTLTVTDNNGNTSTCTAIVTVQDTENPIAICQDITVNLDANGNASITAAQIDNGSNDNCGSVTLSVMPNTFDCLNLGANTVTLTATDTDNNTATCDATVTILDPVSPVAICQNTTLNLEATGNVTLAANVIDNGSSDACGIINSMLSQTTFTCANVGSNNVVLTVEDASGNMSSCNALVMVNDTTNPTAVCQNVTLQLDATGNAVLTTAQVNSGSADACGISSMSLDMTNFDCTNIGGNTVVLTVTDNNANTATCNAVITVEDNVAPNAVCQNISIALDASGSATITPAQINNGSTDACGIAMLFLNETLFTCADIGANTVTLIVTDTNGNVDNCSATVTVTDSNAPTAVCMNATIQLDATGNILFDATLVDGGSSAPCGTMMLSVSPNTFTCGNVGTNTVTLTVTANNGMTTNCMATVTVEDNGAPMAVCQNFTAQLNVAGMVTVTAANIDNGSSDACGIATLVVAPNTFDCTNIGANPVTLMATDNNGNTDACTATVTVEDNVNPNPICQNITVQLDAAGNAAIVAADIDNGSNDACGIASVVASQTAFTCENMGGNTVVLTVTDNNGNMSTCNANVVVQDNINPTAVCQNIIIQLDAVGNASITGNDLDNGSADACGIVNYDAFPNAFTCTEIGVNNVVLSVEDSNGNTAMCNATVTVQDTENPMAVCQDLIIQLDANGDASITAAQIDNGSSDNCAISSIMVSPNVFDCSNMGDNTVTLTVIDTDTNSATCTATVTVEDSVSPVAICQNVTIQLDANGNITLDPALINNNSTDACSAINLTATPNMFDCTNVGINIVTLTVEDAAGNMSTCTADVTVEDNTDPIALCQNIAVDLDNTGNVTINAMQIDNGSSDACDLMSIVSDIFNFDCTTIGANPVVLSVTDMNGNTATCNATVTVNDNENPMAVCQDISVGVGVSGSVTIMAAQIDNGSTDNCNIATLSVSLNTFTCNEVGTNNVTLTVTDASNNTNTCTAVVTVTDSSVPTAACQNATLQLDAMGNATLDATLVDGGSSAPCGTMTLSVLPNTFTCADIGANTVTLTVEDNNGMTDDCTATVTVEDNVNPTAICMDATLQLDAAGNATLAIAQIDNGSNDACGIANLMLSQTAFTCANIGDVTVTLTATDNNTNSGTCTATVTVEDNMNPVAMCQNITTQLDANGMAIITGAGIDNGSTDACGIAFLVTSQTTFTCAEIGNNNVTLTVTDNSGNMATCVAIVTIEDIMPPTAVCQNITVQLNVAGNASITTAQIDNGSMDNCGVMTIAASQTAFTCTDLGNNNVTLTVTANNGETATCTTVVTVQDNIDPTAVCQDIQITLDAAGSYALTAAEVDNGSADNCNASLALSLNVINFDCNNVGNNIVTLTATDAAGNTDTCIATLSVFASNACTTPTIANTETPSIDDPCTCLGNERFEETVFITAMGSGQLWAVQATTLIDPNTGVAFTAGTMFTEQPAMGGMIQYTLVGNHFDGQGYTISATSPFFPGVVLEFTNTCYYPDPVIVTDLSATICAGTTPIVLEGNAGAGIAGTGVFTINGNIVTEIDPTVLGMGNFLLTYTFDAGTAGGNDPTDPGCEDSITAAFEIEATPTFQGCNNDVTVVLGPTCEALVTADVILEGDFGCVDDYMVTLTDEFGQGVPNPITSVYIGQTVTGTVTHVPTGNNCSSLLLIEDSIAPTIDCQPITITCMDALPPFGMGVTGIDNCDADPDEILLNQVFNTDDNCTDAVPNDDVAGFVTVTRTYRAVDAGGMQSAECEQIITITRPDDVDFPEDIYWTCEQYAANPNIIDTTELHPDIIAGFGTEFPVGPNGFGFDLTSMAVNDVRLTNNVPNSNPARPTGAGVPSVGLGTFCNYSVTYSDNVLGICGFGNSTSSPVFKVLRTWTVLDWCTGQVITTNNAGEDNVQAIVVMDTEGPTFTGADVTLSTTIAANGSNGCSAIGIIPMPIVTDNCTTVDIVQAFVYSNAALTNSIATVDANGIINPALEIGNYFIGYSASDVCGNMSQSQAFNLTIVDNESPTMICDEITEINVPSTGVAVVPASVFDDGSFDNCCLQAFSARRMDDNCGVAGNTTFGPTVTFCCADAGAAPVTIIMQATDCNGNSNTCMVIVNIGDKIDPVVSCPADATIDCDMYEATLRPQLLVCNLADDCESNALTNAGYGDVTTTDNCGAAATPTVIVDIDNCGNGTITRSFVAVDGGGNTSNTCMQTITINHASDWVVEFGIDTILTCGATLATVEDTFGEPVIFGETCEMIATSFQDELFTQVQDACFKVVRTWKVINWCVVGNDIDQEMDAIELSEMVLNEDLNGDGVLNTRTFRDSYRGILPTSDNDPDADNQDGFITYIQTVKVIDEIAPVFVANCDMADVCIDDNTCGATVNFVMPIVTDCVDANLVTITATSILGVGFGPFNGVAPGDYVVTYQATDNCGNVSICTSNFEVIDCVLPSPVCVEGLIVELSSTNDPNDPNFVPTITIDIDLINAGAFDNCPFAAGDALKLSFTTDINDMTETFTCDSVGIRTVRMYVTDAAGLQDFCETEVEVQANQGQCSNPLIAMVTGNVTTENTADVQDVMIHINGDNVAMDYMTDAAGIFDLNVPMYNDYTITPEKDDNHTNGVTTFDLVKINKHILNIQYLDSPYKMIAADANNSGAISTLDLVHIRKLILQIDTEFSNNTSWRFVDAAYVFPDPTNPWVEAFPEIISINNLEADMMEEDFIAVKIGDVNGTAQANQLLGADDRTQTGALRLQTIDQLLKAGETYTVVMTAANFNHFGYQFTMQLDTDKVLLDRIDDGLAKAFNFGTTYLADGILTTSWNEAAATRLATDEALFTLQITALTDGKLSDAVHLATTHTNAEAYAADGDLETVELTFNTTNASTALALYQNQPNPFTDATTIGFYLPTAQEATLIISDLSGRIVYTLTQDFAAGEHAVTIERKDVNSRGVLYYRLETNEGVKVKKMILKD